MSSEAAARPGGPAIEVVGLHVGDVLGDLDLALAAGERVALLGRNGIGKSSLLRAVAGLRAPSAGTARVRGRLGYVPQDCRASLFPWYRVRTNLALGRGGSGDCDLPRALQSALQVIPLRAELLDRFAGRLSGGEQQLTVLARALVADPEVLLLDEPFAALDAPTRVAVRQSLARWLDRTGATLLLVSHDLDDTLALAQRAVVLGGRPARVLAGLPLAGRRASEVADELSRVPWQDA